MKDPAMALIDAVENCDYQAVLDALDRGATGNSTDRSGNPAWWILLRLILYPDQAQDQADILGALFDAGLEADNMVANEIAGMIEPQNPLCAAPLIAAVAEDRLQSFSWSTRPWWQEKIAAHHAKALDQNTPNPMLRNGVRL